MSFEDDDIDNAYKLLEGTEKFCDPSRGLAGLFSSSTVDQHLTGRLFPLLYFSLLWSRS